MIWLDINKIKTVSIDWSVIGVFWLQYLFRNNLANTYWFKFGVHIKNYLTLAIIIIIIL